MNGREQNCDMSDPLKRVLANGPSVEDRAIGDGELHHPCKELRGNHLQRLEPYHPLHSLGVLFEGSNGDLYNHLEIDVSIKLDGDNGINVFECEEIIEGMGALAMAVFPELAEFDLIGETELSSLCK
ncbi:hypothetical protein MMC21_001678 [Puttea exsequens]|nr:hypothetical protein [Puttea exsequens]